MKYRICWNVVNNQLNLGMDTTLYWLMFKVVDYRSNCSSEYQTCISVSTENLYVCENVWCQMVLLCLFFCCFLFAFACFLWSWNVSEF